jgi:hypothetical protein
LLEKLTPPLSSTIINHMTSSAENHTVAYFYCIRDAQHPKNADPEEILRAILKQLVILLPSQHSDRVKAKYEKEKRASKDHGSIRRLAFKECAEFILELATDRTVTIVIDALDECRENKHQPSEGGHKDRQDLLDELEKMVVPGNIKLFLSSRGDVDIWDRLQDCPIITLNASKNGGDILRFIQSEVDDLIKKKRYLRNDENLKREIIKAVDDRSDGMLVLISLILLHV